jgi:hypothetical protein
VTSLFLLPLIAALAQRSLDESLQRPWWSAERGSAGLSPDPKRTPVALVQVFAARAVGWRGAVGVHTWFATKEPDASNYTRYEVLGWGVGRGRSAVRSGAGVPDGYWFGARPTLLAELRGAAAERAIAIIEEAVRDYPYARRYQIWPGPNSNTFTAYIARLIPELRVNLPPTAVGKDYLPWSAPMAKAPSGTGVQLNVGGVMGLLIAGQEGIEIQLLGLTLGVDLNRPALKLPGLGRIGLDSSIVRALPLLKQPAE